MTGGRLMACPTEPAPSAASPTLRPSEGSPSAPHARDAISESRAPIVGSRSNTTRPGAKSAWVSTRGAKPAPDGKAAISITALTAARGSKGTQLDAFSALVARCEARLANTGRAARPTMTPGTCWRTLRVTPEPKGLAHTSSNTSWWLRGCWVVRYVTAKSSTTSTRSRTTTDPRTCTYSRTMRRTWRTMPKCDEQPGLIAEAASMSGFRRMFLPGQTVGKSAASAPRLGRKSETRGAESPEPRMVTDV